MCNMTENLFKAIFVPKPPTTPVDR
jgi:hypothetical protein